MKAIGFVLMLCACAAGVAGTAAETAWDVPMSALQFTEGSPAEVEYARGPRRGREMQRTMAPRVILETDGEAFAHWERVNPWERSVETVYPSLRFCFVLPGDAPCSGVVAVVNGDGSGMERFPFTFDPSSTDPVLPEALARARQARAEERQRRPIPGTAWFRHQAREARKAAGDPAEPGDVRTGPNPPWERRSGIAETYALFNGGRAVAENLQLDRTLDVRDADKTGVAVDRIPGITVREFDWTPWLADAEPALDPLARAVPADQHVLFMPSFAAASQLLAESRDQGVPVLRLLEPRAEDARVLSRYEIQMGFRFASLADRLGPAEPGRFALTGGDPYLRLGSDVALLIEVGSPEAAMEIIGKRFEALAAGLDECDSVHRTTVAGTTILGVHTPDRAVSAYAAALDGAIVLSNSEPAVAKVARAAGGKAPALADGDDYRFFRTRYPLDDPAESALLILSDATIRRWCGPRWRIGASRRLRAASVLSDLHARNAQAIVETSGTGGPVAAPETAIDLGEATLERYGVRSSIYGSLGFLTPISELAIEEVSVVEREAYSQWRDGYERNWTRRFDPIAIRLTIANTSMEADITVMPLIAGTRYRGMMEVSRGATIDDDASDRHPEALIHQAMAINAESPTVRSIGNMAIASVPGMEANALQWLGGTLSVCIDDGPFWREAGAADDLDEFMEKNVFRMPLLLTVESRNPIRLAAFLAGLRTMIDQSAPGMLQWEARTFEEQPYVRVGASPDMAREMEPMEDLALYYAPTADALILSLSESTLHRALARRGHADDGEPEPAESSNARPWLGEHFGLNAADGALTMAEALFRESYLRTMQQRAWAAIPILNEWKRLYPEADPVGIHERLWGVRLVCPGDGRYAWNKEWQTMESTVYGHPGAPREGPSWPPAAERVTGAGLGLTFEQDGLRARARIERRPAQGTAPIGGSGR